MAKRRNSQLWSFSAEPAPRIIKVDGISLDLYYIRLMESSFNYTNFLTTVAGHGKDVILFAVFSDHDIHPVASDLSVVFIYDTKTKSAFHVSWKHGDSVEVVSKKQFCKDFSSLKNRKWVFDKKSFIQSLPVDDLLDVNLFKFLTEGCLVDFSKHETLAHRVIYRSPVNGIRGLNNVVPILKHQEMFVNMCSEFNPIEKVDGGYLKENEIVIETLAALEKNGIHVEAECFKKHFDATVHNGNTVFSQYNIYTVTGRPSNHFENVNYAALNKENGVRKCFISRHGDSGEMVLIDYSAFHPRIISHLIKFPLSIDVDIYQYLGESYFGRKNLGSYELEETKKLTFRQLYGGVEEQFEHLKYFGRLKSFININWENFEKMGYVLTPIFKRKITDKHILDPNPNKLFNYILQATETEIAMQSLKVLLSWLKGRKSQPVLYTYDSILFDVWKPESQGVLTDIMTIMKMNERFPIKVYIGDSYDSVSQIYP
jgi:hypothetical protein